jgi:CRP-like cAMP-binding protein
MQRSYHLPENSSNTAPLNIQTTPLQFGVAGFVEALPEDLRTRLLSKARRIDFAKDTMIQSQGAAGHEFWYIRSGNVHIGRHSRDGKFHIFGALRAGQSFGEQAFLGEFPRLVDAVAASDCTLLRIGEGELAKLLAEDGSTARLLLKAMAQIVQTVFDTLETSRTETTVMRTARALLAQCSSKSGSQSLALTQQSLADIIGVSRVSMGKALKTLTHLDLIISGYGSIEVKDIAALYKWLSA